MLHYAHSVVGKPTEHWQLLADHLIGVAKLPPAVYAARKCRACSLLETCRPRLTGRSARAWRMRNITEAIADASEEED